MQYVSVEAGGSGGSGRPQPDPPHPISPQAANADAGTASVAFQWAVRLIFTAAGPRPRRHDPAPGADASRRRSSDDDADQPPVLNVEKD